MTAPIPGVGVQLARAADGTDPRGVLVFESLPSDLRNAEDSTQAADHDRMRFGPSQLVYVELVVRHGVVFVRRAAPPTPPGGGIPYPTGQLGGLMPDTIEARAAAGGLLRLAWPSRDVFVRDATPAERALLAHLGHELPDLLYTRVSYPSPGVRNRTFLPTIEIA